MKRILTTLALFGMLNSATAQQNQIGPVSSFGTLNGPDGTEWTYTANYEHDNMTGYKSAHFDIYNSANTLVGTLDRTFTLAEHQTGINQVQIDPNVTRHFFNTDDNYEIILFIHATTDDYTGCVYQEVFTLTPEPAEPLMKIDGYEVMTVDTSENPDTESMQMVMFREEFTDDDQYFIYFDVYAPATAENPDKPRLVHTFAFDYQLIAGSGSFSMPLCIQKINGKVHYATAYFEQPYFDPTAPFYEDPVVTPDNNFIIDLYTEDSFNTAENETVTPYNTMKIPVITEEGYIYSIPALGSFMGNDDFAVGIFDNTDKPYFVITNDNYVASYDDFLSSFYLYDENGNLVKTIAKDATNYLQMTPLQGHQRQFCITNDNDQELQFIDIPSCETVATIPYIVSDRMLSTTLDRIPVGDTYQYIISASNGDADFEGNVLHPIAYFNADGSLNHWEKVNLGPDVVMAQPAIISDWLNPTLFDTDNDMEYMFLVKIPVSPNTTKTQEHLWILHADGEKLADFGPSEELGSINTIEVLNTNSDNPLLAIAYYDWRQDAYTLVFTPLPLVNSAIQSPEEGNPAVSSSTGNIEIFTANGEKIGTGTHTTLPHPGLYIIRSNGQTKKVIIK